MNLVQKVRSVLGSSKAFLLSLFAGGLVFLSTASAQTGDWDISGAQTTVTALLAVGAAITIAMVIFKLGKRGANKV